MIEGAPVGRRRFLAFLAAAAAASLAPDGAEAALRSLPPRVLAFENVHTGEKVKAVYWADGRYQAAGLRQIDRILRDYRTGEVVPIDRELLDTLSDLQRRLQTNGPFRVLSGYRSPETNAMLAAMRRGVVRDSLHVEAMAIDLQVPGRRLSDVRRAAMSLRAGGVGYYPRSGFVHVDVGRVRYW